jgi:transposase
MYLMNTKNDIIVKLLMKHIKTNDKLYKSFNFSHKRQKYKLSEYLIDILYVLKTGIGWRDIRSHIGWNSIYKVYVKLNTNNIFKLSYIELLNKYIKKGVNGKLKYIMTDTSFIPNKKGKNIIGYNKYYNKKNGTKISLITDTKGIPINIECYKGNENDGIILMKQLDKPNLIEIDQQRQETKYFMADKGYDSKIIREKLRIMKYNPLIAQNKRNIKDPQKLITLKKREKEVYKKRLIIENTFNKIKMNKRICTRYDSDIENYVGFIYLSFIKMIC